MFGRRRPNPFHPDLRVARILPRTSITARNLRLARVVTRIGILLPNSAPDVVQVQAGVSVRVFRPSGSDAASGSRPALLWIHGGGYVAGAARLDDANCRRFAEQLEIVVASVEYRLAPEHPFPTPLRDCWAALRWLAEQPDVAADRIAVGGASAGGGLAAALAVLAQERGEVRPVLQLLSYPMLDDRTTQQTDVDDHRLRMWNVESNRFGWRSYLGSRLAPGATDVPPLAAPARSGSLSGLPAAWIGVGTCDLFHDEDVSYAERLREAGVPCVLHVVPGAYHGFDIIETRAKISRDFLRRRTAALCDALYGHSSVPTGS